MVAVSAGLATASDCETVPPAWEILPIPRYVDYGAADSLVDAAKVAIVRRPGSMYQTVRDARGTLQGPSTVIEEELLGVLKEHGLSQVPCVSDTLPSYDAYDTLIVLGNPQHNALAAQLFAELHLSFANWDDPHTPEKDFQDWKDLGREGYLLKVGQAGGKNVVLLAGYDYDDARQQPYGAGTFYALQSFKQLIVQDGAQVRIKTAEVADKPLLAHRGCFTAFFPGEDLEWWKIKMMAAMKANANIYWYGDNVGAYSTGASAKFRYPWAPESLSVVGKFGQWCREHFISMNLCMNPDHYNCDWAAARTFDGTTKDPLHYDPQHAVEPQFRELWAKVGYDVKNDVDIVAAKFAQMNAALGGGATLIMQNEDDVFGLVHPDDKQRFQTETADPKQNAINYGKARAQFLIALYRRVRELAPDSYDVMPICLPDGLAYQTPLETNEFHSRDFMEALAAELREAGLQEKMPVTTSGGGTQAEVVGTQTIDNFRSWCAGSPAILVENNFALGRIGAYETDPQGPRWPMQRSERYPAGFHDRELYRRLWGVQWNMNSPVAMPIQAWCQSQYMWNMLALEKTKVDVLATRKVCSAASYPCVRSFFEEFSRPACYCPDDGLAPMMVVCDTLAFPRKNWQTVLTYTDDTRIAAQRVRDKFARLLPELAATWEDPLARHAALRELGYNAFNFCSIYLARGYIQGWKEAPAPPQDQLEGERLRDLYLEADEIQERYFNGPEELLGRSMISRNYYSSVLNRLYIPTLQMPPKNPADAKDYVDIWKDGLLGTFFTPVSTLTLADVPDGDQRLVGSWGKSEEVAAERFRTIRGESRLTLDASASGRLLIRAKIGTAQTALVDAPFGVDVTPATPIHLVAGSALREDAVCRPRWITWLLPVGATVSELQLRADAPVRVYAVEVYQATK